MNNQVGGKLICLFLLTLATAVSSKISCPFKYIYHFGDGFTDIGNSINVDPKAPNPARFMPYGITYPGWPTGRWCDGLVDFDYSGIDLGLPNIVPYLRKAAATSYDGVIFSTARSPVLPTSFFESKGIHIPSYAVPLEKQMSWFREHLRSINCSSQQDCRDHLASSLMFMGDVEGNDVTYALTQGMSIKEVKTYAQDIIDAQINAARILIESGGKRMLFPENGPIGCFPFVLTALWTTNTTEYDELGCLKSVNELIAYKNDLLHTAVANLQKEFPDVYISYPPFYDRLIELIKNKTVIGLDGINKALKSCCGIGGSYNYDGNRFCGSPGVPVCPNPNEYLFWDGIHLTAQGYHSIQRMLIGPAFLSLNCTSNGIQSSKPPSSIASF